MENPLISIIIPTYNREKLIVSAIESVMAQTFNNFEILVIDDASTDKTAEVIADMKNPQVRYFKLDNNSGQCIARNHGIRNAQGRYIAFLDSDDRWMPDKLEKQMACFEKGNERLGAVYAYAYMKDVIKGTVELDNTPYYRGDIHDKFLERFCPPTPSLFLVKKEALEKVKGFDEKLITFVDLDLWLRISQWYEFDYVNEPLITKYEQIGDQYVNNFEKRYNGYKLFVLKWRKEITKKKGKAGYRKFKKALVHAITVPILEHPPKNLHRNILRIIKMLFEVHSPYYRLYIKSFFILLFGPNVITRIRKIMGTTGG